MISDARGKPYRPWEPEHYRQEAHSPKAKLPQDDLVFFLLDTVVHLDLGRFYAPYEAETRGPPPFDPQDDGVPVVCMPIVWECFRAVRLLGRVSATWRSSRLWARIDQIFAPSVIFVSCTWMSFCYVFVQVLRIAGESGLVKLVNVATDGTKLQGNAARHKAMSYGYMKKEVERLREEIEALVTQAYQQDTEDDAVLGSRRGDELPAELSCRQDRLATIAAAMQRLEAPGQSRCSGRAPAACRRRGGTKAHGQKAAAAEPQRGG